MFWFCPLGRSLWLAAGWVKGTRQPLGKAEEQVSRSRVGAGLCGRRLEGNVDLLCEIWEDQVNHEAIVRIRWELSMEITGEKCLRERQMRSVFCPFRIAGARGTLTMCAAQAPLASCFAAGSGRT